MKVEHKKAQMREVHHLVNGTAQDSDPELEAEQDLSKSRFNSEGGGETANEQQKFRPAQRRTKSTSDGDAHAPRLPNGMVTATGSVVKVPRSQKNSRKSRGKAAGEAKKRGSGGKWTWGAPGKVYEEGACLDSDDPNYDSEGQADVTFEEMDEQVTKEQLEKYVQPEILQFYLNGDLRDIIKTIREMNLSGDSRPELVRLAVILSLDSKKDSSREFCSQFISEGVAKRLISQQDVEKAFTSILRNELADLVLDYPNGPELLGNFIARAVADMAASNNFIETLGTSEHKKNTHFSESVNRAQALLLHKTILHDIWGIGGGNKPVRYLSRQMQLILQEYLDSGDEKEAAHCLHKLEVPHFHHDFVFQASIIVAEAMHQRVERKLSRLLAYLVKCGELSHDAVVQGFEHFYVQLPDLSLDVPPVYTIAERWVSASLAAGYLTEAVGRKLPQRCGRKRFVSEGDGGRLTVVDSPPDSVKTQLSDEYVSGSSTFH